MKNYKPINFIIFCCLFPFLNIFAVNDLVIKLPSSYSSAKGYIDKATLVVEPHGGYAEESLYLNYSDHGSFGRGQNVEVIHRFELPQGAVINDMWLWIGDSVMKAKMFDTWTARHVYDSITVKKRDPALLTKIGNQYELHIFPLASGDFRRVKINFIVPVKWAGNSDVIEFPLKMLNSNNNTVKPLEVLFRTRESIWGIPELAESPSQQFVSKIDTMGFNYKYTFIPNTAQYTSLNLTYRLDVSTGAYFSSDLGKDSLTYFQTAFSLKDAFHLNSDSTTAKKYLIAVDLSGNFNKSFEEFIPRLKTLIGSALKSNDKFNVIISGAGEVKKLSDNWLNADIQTINSLVDNFAKSPFGESVSRVKLPRLIFADKGSYDNLGYSELSSVADFQQFNLLKDSYQYFSGADAVSYYNDLPDSNTMKNVYKSMDSLFAHGGRFYSRAGFPGWPPSHYIPDLQAGFNTHGIVNLFRNMDGNIGTYFPEKIVYNIDTYFLRSKDPDVKAELTDVNGNPVVISKKIGKGLLIAAGISSAQDDIALRKMFCNVFLGLNKTLQPSGLPALLSAVENEYNVNSFEKMLLISNSDSLISSAQAVTFARDYLRKFKTIPVINSVNLLQGNNPVFPAVTENFTDYYGSGYVLKALSDLSSGINIESHLYDWNYIYQSLSPYVIPNPIELSIEASSDNVQANINEFTEIKQSAEQGSTPRFFIGSSKPAAEIEYKITAKFAGEDSVRTRYMSFKTAGNPSTEESIIPAMLGNERIKVLFSNQGFDTSKIIQMALKYNLLCDYTALIALEPDANNPYMLHPFDEGKLTTGVEQEVQFADSLQMNAFPNPFNSQTRIVVSLKNPSKVSLKIYNILGKMVKEIAEGEDVQRGKVYMWDGKNNSNTSVSSGIYFAILQVKENSTGKNSIQTRKLLLIK